MDIVCIDIVVASMPQQPAVVVRKCPFRHKGLVSVCLANYSCLPSNNSHSESIYGDGICGHVGAFKGQAPSQ